MLRSRPGAQGHGRRHSKRRPAARFRRSAGRDGKILTMSARVAVLRTRPETVVSDYGRLMRLAGYQAVLPPDGQLLLKLNLSWTKYFPACSTQPWQLDGV